MSLEINDATFKSTVIDSEIPVLVDFWAPWCGPCRIVAPILEELAKEYEGKVKIAKLNVDENQNTATEFGIRSIPTLLLFKGGKVIEKTIGAQSKQNITQMVEKSL